MPHAILTAIGADRPGLVDEVSRFIFDRGGNIEDSRMVNLRGQFAMMVLVGAPEAVLGRVKEELAELSRRSGLHAELRPAAPLAARPSSATEPSPAPTREALPFRLTGTGIDQPGLVHRVAHVLREMD